MNAVFYISAAVAIVCTAMMVIRLNVVHSLLYLIVSFIAVALIFFVLGAPFVAALEIIVYAGAIMVLFVFVIMVLNVSTSPEEQAAGLLNPKIWVGPSVLTLILLAELAYVLTRADTGSMPAAEITPKAVGIALMGPYLLAVELSSLLLLAGLVGAYHLGRRVKISKSRTREKS